MWGFSCGSSHIVHFYTEILHVNVFLILLPHADVSQKSVWYPHNLESLKRTKIKVWLVMCNVLALQPSSLFISGSNWGQEETVCSLLSTSSQSVFVSTSDFICQKDLCRKKFSPDYIQLDTPGFCSSSYLSSSCSSSTSVYSMQLRWGAWTHLTASTSGVRPDVLDLVLKRTPVTPHLDRVRGRRTPCQLNGVQPLRSLFVPQWRHSFPLCHQLCSDSTMSELCWFLTGCPVSPVSADGLVTMRGCCVLQCRQTCVFYVSPGCSLNLSSSYQLLPSVLLLLLFPWLLTFLSVLISSGCFY